MQACPAECTQATTLDGGGMIESVSVVHPSLLIAEQLSPEDIWAYNHPAGASASLPYRNASACLEELLCQPPANVTAGLDDIAAQFEACSAGTNNEAYRARIMLASMPLFERRAQRAPYGQGVIRRVYRNIGSLAVEIPFAANSNARGAFYEIISAALGARRLQWRYAIFPSTVREEASTRRLNNFNHDGYSIEMAVKIPLQFRSSINSGRHEKFNPAVKKFFVRDAICAVARHTPEILPDAELSAINVRRPRAEVADALLSLTGRLIHADSQRRPLAKTEQLFLGRLSHRLAKAIDRHANRHHANPDTERSEPGTRAKISIPSA